MEWNFLIEAAMIANNYPPNVNRSNFSFQNWKDYDQDLFDLIKDSVLKKLDQLIVIFLVMIKHQSAISKSKNNIINSGFENSISLKSLIFLKLKKNEMITYIYFLIHHMEKDF